MLSPKYSAKDKQRRIIRRSILRARDYFSEWSKKTDSENIQKCEALLVDIKQPKTEYEQLIYEMLNIVDEISSEEEKKREDELYKELEESNYGVLSLCGRITAFLKGAGARNPRESIASFDTSYSQAAVADIRLPKINIPKFDGDPRKFLKFKALFSNLIHEDTSIPNVRKLYYLQEALEGPAEEFIRDVDMTETSYNTAWSELLNRYENKRVIIRAHLTDLFDIKKIKDESGIRPLLDSVIAILRGLKVCGENPDQWSTLLSFLVSSRLDDSTKRDFENSIHNRKTYPSFKELTSFLETRASAVEDRGGLNTRDKPRNQPSASNSGKPTKTEVKKSFATGSSTNPTNSSLPKCPACNSYHLLIPCPTFSSKTLQERYDIVRKNQLCVNCFGRNHKSTDCRRGNCKTCQLKHHTLLHFNRSSEKLKKDEKTAESEKPKESETVKTCSAASINGVVLLPTAVVRYSCNSKSGFTRILTDPASEATMITETFVRKHRLSTQNSAVVTAIEGVGTDPVYCSKTCRINLKSQMSDFQMTIDCLVVPASAIKYSVAVETIETFRIEMPNMELAETKLPYSSIDIIIGAEYVEDYLLNESVKVNRVTLRNSQFGWLTVGSVESTENQPSKICCSVTLVSIERQLKNLFESKQFEESTLSEEHLKCVEHFESTYRRDPEGRFIAEYPLKDDPSTLSSTKRAAENSVNRIFNKPPEVTDEYHKFIDEYATLNHLTFTDFPTVESAVDYNPYFLPQLIVLRPDKSTTKLRTVLHASYKNKVGKSLNEILMTGPNIQLDLFDIILRFRRHKVAFAADVEKMYCQILIAPKQRQLQKIIYRKSLNDEPKVGILNTLTYGTAPASFIATKCLAVLAREISDSKTLASDVIRRDFYMDDLITGCDSVEESIQLNRDIRSILLSGKFSLRKYISNSDTFLNSIKPNLIEPLSSRTFEFESVKVLGLRWTPRTNQLSISLTLKPLPDQITKRLLSEIASVFDIIGILFPVTIKSKLLVQKLWLERIDWNDYIPKPLEVEFRAYYSDLACLESFSVKRYYSLFLSKSPFDLVGFCDASDKAYCAVVYIRILTADNRCEVSFVCAKTKVAPLKKLTIPQLELQAAHLLSKLLVKVESVISNRSVEKYPFSDSTTVLNWLKKPPETWKQFVANRVRDIQEVIPSSNWRYINTHQNPADLATRGISVYALQNNSCWLNGPELILIPCLTTTDIPTDETALIEQKKPKICLTISAAVTADINFIKTFSSYIRLIGAVAYMRRINRQNRLPQLRLRAEERVSASNAILQLIQRFYYPNEIAALRSKVEIHKRSPLLSMSPFLHSDNILRIGGLRNSSLPFERKHPIILPAKCRFIELYADQLHHHHFHATKSFILRLINLKYWLETFQVS